jgi:protoheme IX farnesyltransferase
VLLYALLLLPIAVSPWLLGLAGRIYGITALVMSLAFAVLCWGVYADKQDAAGVSLTKDKPARKAFKFSLIYLFVLFLACAVDRFV